MESNTSLTVGLHCLQLSAVLCLGVILALILCSGERAELWLAVTPPLLVKKGKAKMLALASLLSWDPQMPFRRPVMISLVSARGTRRLRFCLTLSACDLIGFVLTGLK